MIKKIKLHQILLVLVLLLAVATRLFNLDKYPAGLNADEAAIGYNAYSLIETGMDEHGVSWPLVFRSFDDYKPALYFYIVIPFIKVLGLTVNAVRLPSAILGVFSVWFLYLIIDRIFKNKTIAFLSALVLATSPWHLHFSRGGWEVNASATFLLLTIYLFLLGLKKPRFYLLAVLPFVASMYTYHSMRIIAPLLAIFFIILYWQDISSAFKQKKARKYLLGSVSLMILLALPLVWQMFGSQGQSRFSGVSIFADQGPLWEALEMRRQHPSGSLVAVLLHNRYLSYSIRFFQNYLSHFSPRFLFITGDEIARSKVSGIGQSLLVLAPFYFLGLLNLLKLDNKGKKLTLFWFLIAPLAASLTFQSPHALRAHNMVIPLSIITALGVFTAFKAIKKFKPVFALGIVAFSLLFAHNFTYYLHQYYVHYPKELPYAWEYGFEEMGQYIKENGDQYDQIIISSRYDQPYILTAFFTQYPPDKFQEEIVMTPRDKFGFSTVNQFGKYTFKTIDWERDSRVNNALIIATDEGAGDAEPIYTIKFPGGEDGFRFYTTD